MEPFILSLAWIVGHLILFLAVFRRRHAFFSEKRIFLYHLISATLLTVVLAAMAAADRGGWTELLGSVSLHGIYSLTSLEAWALADGGISGRILSRLARAEGAQSRLDLQWTVVYAGRKKRHRLQSVRTLGLVNADDGALSLSLLGWIVVTGFLLLCWLTNTRRIG
jgi:hypothetical protein